MSSVTIKSDVIVSNIYMVLCGELNEASTV